MIKRKVGKVEVCVVIRVDPEKGYIDLSKKRVQHSEITAIEEKFAKGKTVNAIMRAIVEDTKTDLKQLYDEIVYPLQRRYDHAIDAFHEALK